MPWGSALRPCAPSRHGLIPWGISSPSRVRVSVGRWVRALLGPRHVSPPAGGLAPESPLPWKPQSVATSKVFWKMRSHFLELLKGPCLSGGEIWVSHEPAPSLRGCLFMPLRLPVTCLSLLHSGLSLRMVSVSRGSLCFSCMKRCLSL